MLQLIPASMVESNYPVCSNKPVRAYLAAILKNDVAKMLPKHI